MIFCGQEIAEGTKQTVQIPVPGAQALEALCLCGRENGPTLVVTAGVHGCEYVGVEALKQLWKTLEPETLAGNVILLPLANPSGFFAGAKQVVPEDGVNLNRAFPGNEKGSLSARLAYALEQALYPAADLLADLHSGDCHEALRPLVFFPTVGEKEVLEASCAAAQTLNVPYRVRSTAKNGLYSWAVQKGVPALLIERGGQGLWSEEEVDACQRDVRALMAHMGICADTVPVGEQQEIVRAVYAEAARAGFWYPLVKPDMAVSKGMLLGRLEEFSGKIIQEVRAEFDGVVLYHTLALGVGVQEPLVAYGRTELP